MRNGGTVTKNSTVQIKYIAFFDTLEAAQSYVHPDDSEGTTPDTPDTPAINADYVFIPANKLLEIANAGSVIVENNIPILKVGADKCSTSSMLIFTPNKVDVGFTATGEGSFYDYSHYVIRYKTEGDARTSDTVNLRGADASKTEREKYGGTEQVVKSDTYTYKTIARDTFTKGSGATEAPNANWSSPWITLKMFYGTEGAIYINFIAALKSAEDAADFIASVEDGSFNRPEYEGGNGGDDPVEPPVEPPVTEDTDYILMDANELLLAIGKGEVIAEKQLDYVPYLRLLSLQTNKSSFITMYPHKTTLGIATTGDGSFYDYSHYVIRYKTSGEARTSDTVNFRGYPDGGETNYEKYGGSAQITKSDSYTIKTIARDTFLGGTVYGVTPAKTWTGQYMTLKLFESADVEGYIDIDFITLCKDEESANSFISAYENGEIERVYEKPSIPGLETSYNLQNQTLNTTLMSDASTVFTPKTLLENPSVSFSDITATVEEDADGSEYLNLKVSAGTYGNGGACFAIAGHNLPFNLVEYKFMKIVYEADYDKTMDMSINPYTNSSFSGETWIKGASNPSASAGVEKEYILDLTKLSAKTEITADYTKFNLVCKILGSGSKTITEDVNLKIKYIGFYKSDVDASNATLSSTANASFDGLDVEAFAEEARDNLAENIEVSIPVNSSVKKANIELSSELINELLDPTHTICNFIINCGSAKVSLDTNILYNIKDYIDDKAVVELEFYDDGVYVDITDGSDSIEITRGKVRVLLMINTYDDLAVATVNGNIASDSDIVNGYVVVKTVTPAEIGFATKQYKSFDDASNHWSNESVRFVTSRKLFDGISKFEFAPNASMTRAQAAVMLMRLAGEDYDAYGSLYDINRNAWYASACDWAVDNFIANVDNKFRPDEAITREELAHFIYSYASYTNADLDEPYEETEFTDDSDITLADGVYYCVRTGIINGYPDNSFKPQNTPTRAEAATMITRFFKAYLKGNEINLLDYQNIPFDEENIVLTFIAMSDIHIDSSSENQAAVNFKNAMNVGYELATNDNIDVVFAAGDLVQNLVYDTKDYTYEIDALKLHADNFINEDTYFLFTTGNHDRSSAKSYETNFYDVFSATADDEYRYYRYDVADDCEYDKGNRHAIINGYHFLSVGMHQDYTAYLKPILDKLTANDPYRPVFVQYHYHAADTVYSTRVDAFSTYQKGLRELLDNYP